MDVLISLKKAATDMPKQQTDASGSRLLTYLWIAFGLCVILGQALYHSGIPDRVLLFILIMQLLIAVRILYTTGLRLKPIALCVAGIVIGSWGTLLWLAVMFLWSIRGFAP